MTAERAEAERLAAKRWIENRPNGYSLAAEDLAAYARRYTASEIARLQQERDTATREAEALREEVRRLQIESRERFEAWCTVGAEIQQLTKGETIRGHEKPCVLCDEPCNSLAGNPSLWPIRLGNDGWRHVGCVNNELRELASLREAPAQPPPSPAPTTL